jgi:hypothetical protein
MFYTKTIAARIFKTDQIYKVEEWAYVVYVHGKGISRFVPKKTFVEEFFELRKERADSLYAHRLSASTFRVSNPENGNAYIVEFRGKRVACQCEDYRKQLEFLGAGACKHIYACLLKMGYSSLREYLNAIS